VNLKCLGVVSSKATGFKPEKEFLPVSFLAYFVNKCSVASKVHVINWNLSQLDCKNAEYALRRHN
jgi:hypothetical protein